MTPFYTSMAVLKLDELPSATAEQCKEKCKSGCLSVEWWEKMRLCYECTDPSKKTAYTNRPRILLNLFMFSLRTEAELCYITNFEVRQRKHHHHHHHHHHHRQH